MDYAFLSKTPLFKSIDEEKIREILSHLGSIEKSYQKNEVIFSAGSHVHNIGIVENGSVNIVVNFYEGNSHIFGHIKCGDIFAQNYAAIPEKKLICDVVAAVNDTVILFINLKQILNFCQIKDNLYRQLIHNLFRISAQKSLNLSNRMIHIAPKTIRSRLMSYLLEQYMINKSLHFFIPFDRQQLADYLGVDRSAISNELSKMQKDGLIKFKKNDFILNEKYFIFR